MVFEIVKNDDDNLTIDFSWLEQKILLILKYYS